MMNLINLKTAHAHLDGLLNIPKSLLQKALKSGKGFITWEGRDVSQINDGEFLRKEASDEENLTLICKAAATLSKTALMTKDFYRWLPKSSYISEGFKSYEDQMKAKSKQAFNHWLQIGVLGGGSIALFKAFQLNFNCLNEMDESDCRIQYGEAIFRPATLAKLAFATGVWVLAGLLINDLSDFGLRGVVKEYQLTQDLFSIYKTTTVAARIAFWEAVDRKDEEKAQKIYQQAQTMKNSKEYYKSFMNLHLGIEPSDYKKANRYFDLFIEDVLSQDLKALFSPPNTNTTESATTIEAPNTTVEAPNTTIEAPNNNQEAGG